MCYSAIMDIHSRIKERREAVGLSTRQLGDEVGVSRQTIMLWESSPSTNGKKGTAPLRDKMKKVADVLKTTPEYLTNGIDANVDPNDKYAFIPRYVEARKGAPQVDFHDEISDSGDSRDTYAYRKDFLAKIGAEAKHCIVVLTNDAGVTLGDQLLVNKADQVLASAKWYAFKTPNGALVRRVFLRADGHIELRDSQDTVGIETYAPNALPPILGRVVAAQTTFA